MTARAQSTSNDYQIVIEPLVGEVIAWRGEDMLARSQKARVMHETRSPSAVYFPREDILASLEPERDFKTFCPFKGTAAYSHVSIGSETHPRGAWSYPSALPEGKGVEGYLAFNPEVATRIELDGGPIEPVASGNITGPTVDWLLREAWLAKTPEDLVAALGQKLIEDGIAVSRMTVLIWSLHPMIAGRHMLWTREDGQVESRFPSYDILESPQFQNSPLRHVADGLGGIRTKLDSNPDEFQFPVMDDLRAKGVTDYVAMPLPFSDGRINVLTLASDHPKGFTTANLGLIFECSALISRLFEVFALTSNATSLLETYLGKRTGERVLSGKIRRGDGDVIDAAILFCDLRHSTRLETDLGRDAYLKQLNRFFEVAADIVNDHGGEVLKFIGDAVLAIFPANEGRAEACRNALESAKVIAEKLKLPDDQDHIELDCAIGIAYGDVTYGNVGSKERLDFTVIGGAANLSARLGDYGKKSGHTIVVSADVASEVASQLDPLGALDLHNVAEAVEAFGLAQP